MQLALSPLPSQPFDLSPRVRLALAILAGGLFTMAAFGAARWTLGYSPPTPWVRDAALTIHLWTVIPAIPLGAFIFLSRKGGARHRLLGKIWLSLMGVTATATLFIRNLESGGFSFIHLFTLLTFIAIPKAIMTARRGDIAAHKGHMLGMFIGALLIAGLFSFTPGRTMWQWLFA